LTQRKRRGRRAEPADAARHKLGRGVNPAPRLTTENLMKSNVGSLDRIVRALIGVLLLALTATGTIGLWGWIGLVPLATAAVGTCPLYTLLGLNTCPVKKA
jgi:hypothetical protein